MSDIKVSIFASAIRPNIWQSLFDSLKSTTIKYEIIFGGPINIKRIKNINFPKEFRYIQTGNIKPSQVYEATRRECTGETISWVADDCEFSEDCYGKAYKYWKSLNNEKIVLSIQTIEDGYAYNMKDHSYVGFDRSTPLMAPLCLMSRQFLEDLGGLDRRYVAGQYENSITCLTYHSGGNVLIYRDSEVYIDHQKKHKDDHKFRIGYQKDREVLESIWGKRGEYIHTDKALPHEPYDDKNLLIKSQSNNIPTIWD